MVSKRQYILSIILAVLITALIAAFGFVIYKVIGPEARFAKLEAILDNVLENHVDKLDENQMLEGAISGMLGAVDDKYTFYMTKEEYQALTERKNPTYTGIGVTCYTAGDEAGIPIIALAEGGPAEKAGIEVGDVIVAIGGVRITAENKEELINTVAGESGTEISITVSRNGEETEYTLKRENLRVVQAFCTVFDNGIGYIRLTTFSELSENDFKKCLASLLEEGISGLIIDLRGNLGGMKENALHLAEIFLNKGSVICSTQNNKGTVSVDVANGNPLNIPLAILVDSKSASASELFSGAIQGNGKGILVGTTTFGKGIVQYTYTYSDGSYYQFTAEQWFTPSGEMIHGKGLTPDIAVENDEALAAFIDENTDILFISEEDKQLLAATDALLAQINNGRLP